MSGRPCLGPSDTPPARTPRAVDAGARRFLLISPADAHAQWLDHALRPLDAVVAVAVAVDTATVEDQIARHRPHALILDFGAAAAELQALPRMLARRWPGLPLLGLGRACDPQATLAALRAGVHDFIDLDAAPAEAHDTLAAVLARAPAEDRGPRGRTVALLGARAGIGVTTLAANLAVALQDSLAQSAGKPAPAEHGQREVALLDLGLPARDGLLYLDGQSTFSFVDGVRNLQRLDRTLVSTALAHHASGAAVLPLPAALGQMREVSHADAVAVIERLGEFFACQIVDLGGFAPLEFVAQVAHAADRVLLVCDQSLGAIVSSAAMVRELAQGGLAPERLALVVNQFEPRAGLSAADIAARLGLPLAHVLPARRAALLGAAGMGQVLVRSARGDAYAQAVLAMARELTEQLTGHAGAAAGARPAPRWKALKNRLLGKARAS